MYNKQEKAKDARLKREYHTNLEDYKKVFKYQKGICYICKRKYNKKGEPLILHLDHCHFTGRLRGLICWQCNKGIAVFQDDIDRFRNAVLYFEKVPFTEALGHETFTAPGRVGTKARKKLLENMGKNGTIKG